LWQACTDGDWGTVKKLADDPTVDFNWIGEDRLDTSLHRACRFGHFEIVEVLLARSKIEVNRVNKGGASPFNLACQEGHKEVVSLLLADPRIDPNGPHDEQRTPLWMASQNGHLVAVQYLLASGREVNTRTRSTLNNKTAAEQGRRMVPRGPNDTEETRNRKETNGPLCADLIDEYERDPVAVRHQLRRQPGLREHFIGHLFALVVFHSDSFVVINRRTAHPDTRRFFRITSQLPLDLQMVLCNRIFGSPRDIILSRDSEPGFQLLARTTTWQQ